MSSQDAPAPSVAVDDLRRITVADVFKAGRLAGTLTREKDRVAFNYRPDYAADPSALPVATTLAVAVDRPVVTEGGSIPPYFAGLLPEGARLQAIAAVSRASLDDQLTLLLAVGSDTVGDVTVLPQGSPPQPAARLSAASLATMRASELFSALTGAGTLTADSAALPGVQPKVSAQMMSLPLATSSGPAIMKLSPPGYPRLVENEAFFLNVARAAGLQTPAHEIAYDRAGEAALLVRRFDRDQRQGAVVSLAQEDACQVLGRYPAAKYRLSLQEAILGLAETVAAGGGSRALTVRRALEVAAFSYAIGNGDLHGKNLSIRKPLDSPWELTPVYDVLSTQPYLAFRDPMALPLFGRGKRLARRYWLEASELLGIPPRALVTRLDRIAVAVRDAAARVASIGLDDAASQRLAELMDSRAAELELG